MSPKKTTSRTSSGGRTSVKASKKSATGKSAAKKVVTKKAAVSKATGKKAPPKKAAVKKVAPKKAGAKKAAAKKSVDAKPSTKKASSKKLASKKKLAKKTAPKKTAAGTGASVKAKKPAKKLATQSRSSGNAEPKKLATKASRKRATPATKVTQVAKNLGATASSAPKRKLTSKPQDYEKFRIMLQTIRRRLRGDVSMMSQEALETGGDNHAPIHPAEAGTHSFEQEFTLNLLSSDGDRLEQIEAALEKITDGTYGACEECGGRIPKARLEVIPDTPYCVKCASKLEG